MSLMKGAAKSGELLKVIVWGDLYVCLLSLGLIFSCSSVGLGQLRPNRLQGVGSAMEIGEKGEAWGAPDHRPGR